jgi:tetratricopeptide (TPR) repeat protein
MRNITMITCLIFLSLAGFAQTADELVQQANKAMNGMKETEALDLYKQALAKEGNNIAALCGASFMCSRVGNRQTTTSAKKAYFKEAKAYALKSVKLSPNSSTANYVSAVAMGRMALISGSKEKVAASRDIKRYAEQAIKLNPKNAKAYSVLGTWHKAVTNLNFAEKAAANMLFGGIPDGDIKTAISNFEKCRQLDPSYIHNYLELGMAYKQTGDKANAKEVLQAGLKQANNTPDDDKIKGEIKKLLATL